MKKFEIEFAEMLELLGILEDVLKTKRLAKTSRERIQPVVTRLVAEVERQRSLQEYKFEQGDTFTVPITTVDKAEKVFVADGKLAAVKFLRQEFVNMGEYNSPLTKAVAVARAEGWLK